MTWWRRLVYWFLRFLPRKRPAASTAVRSAGAAWGSPGQPHASYSVPNLTVLRGDPFFTPPWKRQYARYINPAPGSLPIVLLEVSRDRGQGTKLVNGKRLVPIVRPGTRIRMERGVVYRVGERGAWKRTTGRDKA